MGAREGGREFMKDSEPEGGSTHAGCWPQRYTFMCAALRASVQIPCLTGGQRVRTSSRTCASLRASETCRRKSASVGRSGTDCAPNEWTAVNGERSAHTGGRAQHTNTHTITRARERERPSCTHGGPV